MVKGLKKTVRIKALPVLLAWCVIFAHSIIPHYHIEERHTGCCEIIHRISVDYNSISSFKPESSHDEKTACHFSSLVFHNLQTDTLFYHDYKGYSLLIPDILKIVVTDKSVPLTSDNGRGIHSLRAPPLSC